MSFLKEDFFAKIGIFCKLIGVPLLSVVQAYTKPYWLGGRIKLIICQIRYELCVTIHEISTGAYKNMPAYLMAIYDIGFCHLIALSLYIRFVGDQVFLEIFLQLTRNSENEY